MSSVVFGGDGRPPAVRAGRFEVFYDDGDGGERADRSSPATRVGRFEVFHDSESDDDDGSGAPGAASSPWPPRGVYSSRQFPRVFAVGDVHGDFEATRACLMMTGCVSADLRWAGGAGVAVVFLGDVVDRWRNNVHSGLRYEDRDGVPASVGEVRNEEASILDVLNRLAAEAARAGSAVFRLFGNHEFLQREPTDRYTAQMLYASPWAVGLAKDEVTPATTEAFAHMTAKYRARHEAFSALGEAGTMRRRLVDGEPLAILKIGPRVFVHGGATPELLDAFAASGVGADFISYCNHLARGTFEGTLSPAEQAHFRAFVNNAGPSRQGSGVPGILWDDTFSNADHFETARASAAAAPYAAALFRKLDANLSLFHAGLEPTRGLVVSHCIQTESRFEGFEPAAAVNLDGLPYVERAAVAPSEFRNTVGRRVGANSVTEDGSVWRVDVAMSRAFLMRLDGPDVDIAQAAELTEVSKPTIVLFEPGRTAVRRWRYALPS